MIIREYIQFFIISLLICLATITSSNAEQTVERISPTVIRAFVRTQGTVTITLTHEKTFTVNTGAKFYQGEIKLRSGVYPVAASVIGNEMRITFQGKVTGSRKSRQRTFTIKSKDNFASVRVASMPRSAHPEKACATESHEHEHKPQASALEFGATTVKVVTISTTADAEWVARFGTQANAEIASIINEAEALYERQLGIRFNIVSQVTQSSSTPELDPKLILNRFQDSAPVIANAQYLFTGKDMSGSTIGIAYVGAICYAPEYAYGVVQHYSSLTANVFAHEMGHSFGAQHDFAGFGSLMYPSISYGTPYFSAQSINEISTFVSYFGYCLTTEQTIQKSKPAKMVIKRTKRVVTVTLLDKNNKALADEPVTIRANGATLSGKTNTRGKFTIVFLEKRNTTIRLIAIANNNTRLKKKLTFKIQ
jgi:hypothetical protein